MSNNNSVRSFLFASIAAMFVAGCGGGGGSGDPPPNPPPPPTPTDTDGDGVADNVPDNCVSIANADQADLDGDGIGNVCDDDRDGDGVANDADAFPDDSSESADADNDGIGDNADTDDDNDGVDDSSDAFPNDPNESVDTDGDGVGNNADTDDDNDGFTDDEEIACGSDPLDDESVCVVETAYTLHWFKILDPVAFQSDFATKSFEVEACISGTDVVEVRFYYSTSPNDYTYSVMQDGGSNNGCAPKGTIFRTSFEHGFTPVIDEQSAYGGKVTSPGTNLVVVDKNGKNLFSLNQIIIDLKTIAVSDSEFIASQPCGNNLICTEDIVNVIQSKFEDTSDTQNTYKKFLEVGQDVYTLAVIKRYGNQVIGGAGQLGRPGALTIVNNVRGIGKNVSGSAAAWGSSVLEHIGFLNTAISSVADVHETIGHQFCCEVNDNNLDLMVGLTGDDYHIGHTDLVDGQMRTGLWIDGVTPKQYVPGNVYAHLRASTLELYLMGLDTLPGFQAITDSSVTVVAGQDISSNDLTSVSQSDMESVYGPRVPSVADSPKDFNVIRIVSSETPLSDAALAWESLKSRHMCSTSATGSFENGVVDPIGLPAYTHFKATFDCTVKLK